MSVALDKYSIAMYDVTGGFMGFYAVDQYSGGNPYISQSTRQAETMAESTALVAAEQLFAIEQKDFKRAETCVVGRFIIAEEHTLQRSNYKEAKNQREIAKRQAEIDRLQNEILELSEEQTGN